MLLGRPGRNLLTFSPLSPLVVMLIAIWAPAAASQDDFRSLLAGPTLDGWQVATEAATRVAVQDGMLILEGDSKWVVTDADYFDFVLRFEAHVQGDTEAGVFVRAMKGVATAARTGYEIAIADNKRRAGRLLRRLPETVSMLVPNQATVSTGSRWQTFEITCRENVIVIAIDGTIVLKARGLLQNNGQIGFRAHTGRLAIKNIQLAEIPIPRPDPPPGVIKADHRGVTLPRPISQPRPDYTRQAFELGTQGTVWIACVIGRDGKPTDLRVVRSLTPDLDAEAVRAARRWRFEPGTFDGKPVDVQVMIELTFRMN